MTDTLDDLTGLSPEVAMTAAEIRNEWKDDERRKVVDPVGYVVAALIRSNIKELDACQAQAVKLRAAKQRLNACIAEYAEASATFLDSLFQCRKFMAWLYEEPIAKEAGLSVTQVIAALHKDPESFYNAVHRSESESVMRALIQVKNHVCPLCESRIG